VGISVKRDFLCFLYNSGKFFYIVSLTVFMSGRWAEKDIPRSQGYSGGFYPLAPGSQTRAARFVG